MFLKLHVSVLLLKRHCGGGGGYDRQIVPAGLN